MTPTRQPRELLDDPEQLFKTPLRPIARRVTYSLIFWHPVSVGPVLLKRGADTCEGSAVILNQHPLTKDQEDILWDVFWRAPINGVSHVGSGPICAAFATSMGRGDVEARIQELIDTGVLTGSLEYISIPSPAMWQEMSRQFKNDSRFRGRRFSVWLAKNKKTVLWAITTIVALPAAIYSIIRIMQS